MGTSSYITLKMLKVVIATNTFNTCTHNVWAKKHIGHTYVWQHNVWERERERERDRQRERFEGHMVNVCISREHYRSVCQLFSRANIKSLRSLAEAPWLTHYIGLAFGLVSTRVQEESEYCVRYARGTNLAILALAHSVVRKLESDVRNQFPVGMPLSTDAQIAFRMNWSNFGAWPFQCCSRLHVVMTWWTEY